MISFDHIAQQSAYKHYHPTEKILMVLLCIISILLVDNPLLLTLYLFGGIILLLFVIKVPWSIFKLCIGLPLPFVLMTCVPLAITLNFDGGLTVGIAHGGLLLATRVFLKNMSSLMLLYGLILTTPLHHLISGLRYLKCPDVLIEIMLLVYKYIFIFIKTSAEIYRAQKSRSGYGGFSRSLQSFSLLVTSLFIKSMKQGHDLFQSLQGRGYTGVLHGLHDHGKICYLRIISVMCINAMLIMVHYMKVGGL